MKGIKKIVLGFSLFGSLLSCNVDDRVENTGDQMGGFHRGVLVANEGNYGKPNAEISYINYDIDRIQNDIYKTQNSSENLGDVLQNVGFYDDKAYFVLNNSNKIVIADRYTFKKKTVITQELAQPRYIAFANGNYYVTNALNNGYVAVYSIDNNNFITNIPLGKTAETIVKAGENLFVQNASYGTGNTLTIISPNTNAITATLQIPNGDIKSTVGYKDKVFVLAADANNGYIYQYNPDGTLVKTHELSNHSQVSKMDIYNDTFYFTAGISCYAMPFAATQAPITPLFTATNGSWATFYGFNVIEGFIYTSDAKLFTQNSEVNVYNTHGKLIKTFTSGMGTNAFYKN